MANILIIDDDEDFAGTIALVLKSEGHEVEIELDPQHGLENILNNCPDLLIVDVMFPGEGSAGFDLARTVRNKFAKLPLLMLTAVNQHYSLGFGPNDIDSDWMPITDFLEKPVETEVLKRKVKELLR